MHPEKYQPGFFAPPTREPEWIKKNYIDRAPTFVSVDLRDGNQALSQPMSLSEKLSFFRMLIEIGFKEIEVGFPAANQTEFDFARRLIEDELIPDDVTIQVLTLAKEEAIDRTFDAIRGARHAIVHLFIATSPQMRDAVLHKSMDEVQKLAVSGARRVFERATDGVRFEYSPEHFTATEMGFSAEVINAVLEQWHPTAKRRAIVNLPSTVELSMPHVYANQVAYIASRLPNPEAVILSVHTHNDRGCAVAASEMGLLAGATRVEGTLFGNGERTGNADLVTLAMNLYSQGVDPGLDLSDLPAIADTYERTTRMRIFDRSPYAGRLVFAAFSGTHQDAIAKTVTSRAAKGELVWRVPYLPVDPADLGRRYDGDVIRINSQSGKGGIGYLLESRFGLDLPSEMRSDFGLRIKQISETERRELSGNDVYEIFRRDYVDVFSPLDVTTADFTQEDGIRASITLTYRGERLSASGQGNGRLDAVSNALKEKLGMSYSIIKYSEHAITHGSDSRAIAYVGIVEHGTGRISWGAGTHDDIMAASVNALVSAINRMTLP